jgi:hypothetical protein
LFFLRSEGNPFSRPFGEKGFPSERAKNKPLQTPSPFPSERAKERKKEFLSGR